MKVGIIGGGIGGAALARALLARGIETAIFEKAPAFGEVGAGVQITPNAVKAIKGIGLYDGLLARAFHPQAIVGRNWQSAAENFRIPLGEEFRAHYDAPFIHIHRADLLELFTEGLPPGICHFGLTCTGVEQTPQGARALFDDGSSFEADVIVGADGVRSAVRGAVFGETAMRWTGHMCYRALVPTGGVVDHVSPDSSFWMGPNAHVVTYYVKGGEMVNIVAVAEASEWVAESWSTRASREEMLARFEGWHGSLGRLFADVDEVFAWGLFDRDPMESWVRGHVTLLGDACHPMLPFLSQGAGMAIEDALVLAEALAGMPGDIPQALARYQAERLPRTARVQLEARERGRTYHLPTPEEMAARDAEYARRAREEPRTTGINTDWVYDYDPRAFAAAPAPETA
ncbi:FAD-dependent monooxygenase [Mangrovicoccus algicola]|uniref:FAD-dependent monooxygenase n=1 Tax=Mangrovicoccus algicola TaxID=2771008 RepID=A0A8J6Z1J5_9RHOB|nr:FAD-dependent monooxygenase [Mangrovicoccus algicola]MBE3639876.1 FAD-dependent monooxygenase [Mangrovicoccus algicola]